MYDPLLDDEIEVGDALKKEIFDKIQNNFEDHEERINAFEAGQNRIQIFKSNIKISAHRANYKGIMYFYADQIMSVTDCFIKLIGKNGRSAGNLEIDILKSTNGSLSDADFTSIFTTKPKIDYDPGVSSAYQQSSNQVFDVNTGLDPGDILRLDITLVPTTPLGGGVYQYSGFAPFDFLVNCYGEI